MKAFCLFLLLSSVAAALAQSSGRFTIVRSVVAGGGATLSTSSRFQLGGTVGQPAAAAPGSGRFSIQGGFWYRPALEIVAARRVGTNLVFSFETEAGRNYAVQFSDSLSTPDWQTLGTFVGDGFAKTFTQPVTGVTHRFYRLIQQ